VLCENDIYPSNVFFFVAVPASSFAFTDWHFSDNALAWYAAMHVEALYFMQRTLPRVPSDSLINLFAVTNGVD
jgi:hypothetical protein